MANFTDTPDWSSIPAPVDDGGAAHLTGMSVPSISLPATDGRQINLGTERCVNPCLIVVYAYPRTGVPNKPNPDGWDAIPGARGCTPQSCAFRDHFAQLKAMGVAAVYGLSTQDTIYQREAADRLHLPFPLLSDEHLLLTDAMRLPTFQMATMRLLRRLTLVLRDGKVKKSVLPPFFHRIATPATCWTGSPNTIRKLLQQPPLNNQITLWAQLNNQTARSSWFTTIAPSVISFEFVSLLTFPSKFRSTDADSSCRHCGLWVAQ